MPSAGSTDRREKERIRGALVAGFGAAMLAISPLFHFARTYPHNDPFVDQLHAINVLVAALGLTALGFAIRFGRGKGDLFVPRLAGICAFVVIFYAFVRAEDSIRFGALVGGLGAALLVGSVWPGASGAPADAEPPG